MSNSTTTNDNLSEMIGATASATSDDSMLHSSILNNNPISTTTSNIRTALGYCHVCNKQNRINLDSYTCVQCNGGFIEIFDLHDTNEQRTGDIFNFNETNTQTNRTNNSSTSNLNANSSNFLLINNNRSNPGESNQLNAPLLQIIRRLNRSSRNTPSNDHTDNSTTTGSSSLSSSSEQTANSSQRTEPSRFGSSFHYRLRRHANSSSNNTNNAANSSTIGNNNSSGILSSSVYSPSMSSRHHHHHRHRYHRSPTSRFRLNVIDDEELLHDHGAIIITTLLNQLRNTNRGAAPASETQIDSLPLVDIDQMLVEKITQCAICMEEFILNETAKQLPCKHLYHNPCIVQWLKLHATCPVCRTNINGINQSEQDQVNERTNLFNIFPTSATTSLISAATVAAAINNLNESSTTNRDDPQQQQQHQNRRSILRNPHVYRIQIRQALNPTATTSSTTISSNTTPATIDSDYSLRPLRSRRITSPSSSSNTNTASTNNVNTVPCSVVVPRLSPTDILSATTSQNNNRNDGTHNSAFSSLNERNSASSTPSPTSISTGNGSRVASLMDRLFRYNRISNRTSAIPSRDTTTTSSSNNTSSSSGPSAFRFSQLFRSRNLRRNSSSNDNNVPSSSSAASVAAPSFPNHDSDLLELFGVDSFTAPRLRSNRTRPNPETDNRTSLFGFDLLDSNVNNNSDLEANFLGDLFDIPENNVPLLRNHRERRNRNSSSNNESITITIDEDDSTITNNNSTNNHNTTFTTSSMTTNNNTSNNSNIIATLIDSDDANESSYETSSNETNLIGTIDLVSEENSSSSSHSIASTTSSSSSSSSDNSSSDASSANLPHVAKKRKTEST